MKVYLIRHTTPKIEKGICYGQTEVLLADSFSTEASKVLKTLPEIVEAVYSSPLIRCSKLARLIEAKKQIIDERLLEMNFGDWEMKKWNDIDKALLDTWMKNFVDIRVPNGENFTDLNNRVKAFATELLQNDYKNIAIVTHGGVIRCFIAMVLKIPLNRAFETSVDCASVTEIILNSNSVAKFLVNS